MRRWINLAAMLAATGCYAPSFPEGLPCSETRHCPEGQACDPDTDRCSSIDATPCTGDALPFAPRNLDGCTMPVPTGDVVLPVAHVVIDTSASTITVDGTAVEGVVVTRVTQTDGGTPAAVISASNVTIPAGTEVTVIGQWPLIVVAFGALTIDGTLDASASGSTPGPGANRACATGAGTAGITQQSGIDWGGTGGGGGGYGGIGGAGTDITPAPTEPTSVAGGQIWGELVTGPLIGGCSGGVGGVGFSGNRAPPGGGGGGALELIGGASITVTGVVSVSGGGGSGGVPESESSGGAGGGSGGKLLIQTALLTITGGSLTANGGAGGEGRLEILDPGAGGQDGSLIDDVPAGGGAGGTGGDGGAGGTSGDGAAGGGGGGTGDMPAGGGGGGGGRGRILIDARDRAFTDEKISPAPDPT